MPVMRAASWAVVRGEVLSGWEGGLLVWDGVTGGVRVVVVGVVVRVCMVEGVVVEEDKVVGEVEDWGEVVGRGELGVELLGLGEAVCCPGEGLTVGGGGGHGRTTVAMTVTVVSAFGATKVVEKTVVVTVAVTVFRGNTVTVTVIVVVRVTSALFSTSRVGRASPDAALGRGVTSRVGVASNVAACGGPDSASDASVGREPAETPLARR